jgi:hypothetical protein
VWEQPDAAAARAFYRAVVELKRIDAITGLEPVQTTAPADIIAYRRGRLLVLINPRNRPVAFSVQGLDLRNARVLLFTGGAAAPGETELPAHGSRVFLLAEP